MKSAKLGNTLLALIFLVLLAHLLIPMLTANEASAASDTAISPSQAAVDAGIPPLYSEIIAKISSGLADIAGSNREIAAAIRENTKSNEGIELAIKNMERKMNRNGEGSASSSSRNVAPESKEEGDAGWWKKYMDE